MAVKMERETEDEDCSADDVDEFWDDVDLGNYRPSPSHK